MGPSSAAARALPCHGPAVWTGSDLAASGAWLRRPTPGQLAELATAVRTVRTRGTPMLRVTAAQFPAPAWHTELQATAHELTHRCGVAVVRRIPVEGFRPAEREQLLWGLGRHLGTPVSQDVTGHMLGRLPAAGPPAASPGAFRTDDADTTALLCLRPARASLVSSAALHNAVLDRGPELLDRLYRTHHLDRGPRLPALATPLAHRTERHFSLRYDRHRIEAAQARPDVPRLTHEDIALFDLLDAAAASPVLRLDLDLSPGDLLLLDNHAVLHTLAFTPPRATAPEATADALRLWLTPHQPRDLPAEFWGDTARGPHGTRGGVPPRDVITHRSPFHAKEPA
ncbi:TauD/TfdA family dioxygenase [Streptomyces xanthii]|uniref:TauD/TfdA family dioxygenase n=1 Tax=Streptomyces xanthii TaxID=2768069 RepID=A0A7H1B1I3_9ACTN|nr:TauD/TfdA family dioxygenase [Streptomyces xanthii]QNS02588.1 TauD/TfdA family dioxygenase [Streptomyces xanthii]